MVVRIREELKKGEWKVLQIKEKAKQDMISKFGQEIDLDKMAAAVINLELIDEQQNLDQMKKEHYRERRMIGKEVDKVRYGLTKTVKDNSKFNMMKAMMMERRRDIEYYIWKNEKNNSSGLKRVLESTNNATEMTKQLEHVRFYFILFLSSFCNRLLIHFVTLSCFYILSPIEDNQQ